jgi:hypothetical protein
MLAAPLDDAQPETNAEDKSIAVQKMRRRVQAALRKL